MSQKLFFRSSSVNMDWIKERGGKTKPHYKVAGKDMFTILLDVILQYDHCNSQIVVIVNKELKSCLITDILRICDKWKENKSDMIFAIER